MGVLCGLRPVFEISVILCDVRHMGDTEEGISPTIHQALGPESVLFQQLLAPGCCISGMVP